MKELQIPALYVVERSEINTDQELPVLRDINEKLKKDGNLFIKVLEGDYKGSIAMFKPLEGSVKDDVVIRNYGGDFNISCSWSGRLSWKGKKNNPQFIIAHRSCLILEDYRGETLLKRFNLKEESKKLLQGSVEDIDGNTLAKGDKVLYMNLRYGSGGSLCHGTVSDFKAHARQGYLSVLVSNDLDKEEVSDLNYPHQQIYKKV